MNFVMTQVSGAEFVRSIAHRMFDAEHDAVLETVDKPRINTLGFSERQWSCPSV